MIEFTKAAGASAKGLDPLLFLCSFDREAYQTLVVWPYSSPSSFPHEMHSLTGLLYAAYAPLGVGAGIPMMLATYKGEAL